VYNLYTYVCAISLIYCTMNVDFELNLGLEVCRLKLGGLVALKEFASGMDIGQAPLMGLCFPWYFVIVLTH